MNDYDIENKDFVVNDIDTCKKVVKNLLPYETSYNNGMIDLYEIGSIVRSIYDENSNIWGVVSEIFPAYGKVNVRWNNGQLNQHCVEEITLVLEVNQEIIDKVKMLGEKRVKNSIQRYAKNKKSNIKVDEIENEVEVDEDNVPENNYDEVLEKTKEDKEKKLKKRMRISSYHKMRGRIFQRSKKEREMNKHFCFKCKCEMNLEPFTKTDKMWLCPNCGWKIESSKVN